MFFNKDLYARYPLDLKSYFDGLSTSWELKYAPDGSMVGRIVRIVKQLIELVPRGGRVLDFGCGAGDIAAQCGREGYTVEAIDSSNKMVERARSRFRIAGVDFNVCADTLKLPYDDETFNGIVASSVFEYVNPVQPHLTELQRVCIDGGLSLITVPNMAHPLRWLEAVEKYLLIRLRGRLPRFWRERAEYLTLSLNRYSIGEWMELLNGAGWVVIATKQRFNPLMLIVSEKRSHIVANPAEFD